MYFYDPEQFCKDISKIVSAMGERKRRGYYTVGILEVPHLKLKIEDPYISEPIIKIDGERLDHNNISIDSYLGKWVIAKVVEIEDLLPKYYIINHGSHRESFYG